MEPLDVHLDVDDNLLAERADGIVLEVQGVLVALHVPLPRKDLVANITGELAAFALVYLRDVDSQVFGVAEKFVAHAAHVFGCGRVSPRRRIFLGLGQRRKKQFGRFVGRAGDRGTHALWRTRQS